MITGVGSLSLLQGIFLTQEWSQGLLHCTWILYQLGYQGSPKWTLMSFCPWWCRVLLASSGPSPVAAGGAALVATCRLLTLVASLMQSRGSRPGGLQQLQHTGSVVGPLGLGCSTACGIFQTRDRTCLGRDVQCDLLSRYQLLWQNTIDWWTCITNASFSVLVARGPLSGCQHGQVLVRALLMSLHGLPWTVHTEQSWVVSSF